MEALRALRHKVTELLELRHNLGDRSHRAVESQQIQQGRKQFFKQIAAGFGLAFFILVAVGVSSYQSMTRLVETFNQPAQTQNALGEIEKFFSLKDAQTEQQGFLTASQVIPTDKGKNLLDETRATIRKLENEHKEFLLQRSEVASSSTRNTMFTFSSGILLNFFIFVGVYYLIYREMQRQRMEEALRESEARFKAFMDNSPTVAFMKDEEGRYVYFNKPFERRFNINLADCLGKTDFDLWPDAIAKQLRENDTHVLTAEKTVEMLESVPTPDGCLHHWLVFKFLCQDISGRRLVGGVAVDITSRKQVESELRRVHEELELRVSERTKELAQINEALRHSEQRYRFLADTMPQIVWTARPDGASDYYNQHWYDYTGMTFEQTKNWGFILVLHPDDRQLCLDLWSKAVQTGSSYEIEYRKRAWDGTYRWHLGRAVPMRNQNGEIVQWVGTCTDIHEQKQAEEALTKAHEQLELKVRERTAALEQEITERKRAEKQIQLSLQEKEVLLKEIHHRVNNNLQVVESLLRLQSKYTKNEHAVSMFRESQNRIKSMALIHEKLYQSIDLARINFLEYIQSLVASLFRSYSINSTAIIPKIDVTDTFMSIDTAIPCGLIINELVANSLKYAFPDKQGEINICLHSKAEHKFILIVSDNGVGFPKSLDFRNTKTLGLQLVTSLTEQLGAIIELHSDSGTEFRLTFTDVKSEAKK